MGDFDRVDPGGVECGRDPAHGARVDAVLDGVHAVSERDVLDVEFLAHRVASAGVLARLAIDSPTRRAAEVMMSRLPA